MIYIKHRAVFAGRLIPNAVVITELKGIIKNFANKYSLQISDADHLHPIATDELSVEKFIWPYLNHSCNPNAFVDTHRLQLITLRTIEVNEEITFDYETTEWQMREPFECNCKSSNCRGMIKGKMYFIETDTKN